MIKKLLNLFKPKVEYCAESPEIITVPAIYEGIDDIKEAKLPAHKVAIPILMTANSKGESTQDFNCQMTSVVYKIKSVVLEPATWEDQAKLNTYKFERWKRNIVG